MNFTRDPIIETIISAKDGYKLSLKSSKSAQGEEYLVDAVEVVSFSGSFFYRCQEKPRVFFIPASDFEILEVKETRILIKNPNIDKNIKIAGGKEPAKVAKVEEETAAPTADASKLQDQKRDKKKGRRGRTKPSETVPQVQATASTKTSIATPTNTTGQTNKQTPPLPSGLRDVQRPSVFSHLLTPPPGLISDTIERYRQMESTPETLTIEDSKDRAAKKGKPLPKKVKDKEESILKLDEVPTIIESALDDSTASEPPKTGEQLEEKEINAEPFAKVNSDEETH